MQRGIAKTGVIKALGAMSGTSLDGVDAAVVHTDGYEISGFGDTAYRAYSGAERAILAAALGRWSGPEVHAATQVTQNAHHEILSTFQGIDLVGFHGQTLAHEPGGRGTLQVGDGAALADDLDVPVAWDFRTADVAAGGQGAPLAPFFHFACAKYLDFCDAAVFLNLGGVGNLTFVDPSFGAPEDAGAVLAFDTGPANAPVNDLMQSRAGLPFDDGGKMAAQGCVDGAILAQFLALPYFAKKPPKSLDRNDFDASTALVGRLCDTDAAATLTAMAAHAVAAGIAHCPRRPTRILVTGGGRKNPVMMQMLAAALSCPVVPVEDVGLDGDMLEAQAFAFLAVRTARGLPISCPATTGVHMPLAGGRISL